MVSGFGRWAGLTAAGMFVVVMAMGCSKPQQVHRSGLGDPGASPAVDLPPGFYPLRGHFEADNEADSYDGWPRYIVSARDNMIMAYVPTQTLLMGGGTGPDQVPARTVTVNHFYMDLHEVTNAQFGRFIKVTGGKNPDGCDGCPLAALCGKKTGPSEFTLASLNHHSYPCPACYVGGDSFGAYWTPAVNDAHPARNINWYEAWAYSRWSRKFLPTEAQWEAAARGTDRRVYPWGSETQSDQTQYLANTATARANYDGSMTTAPVLNYAAGVSPYGLYNMAGNVWEWTADWYDLARYAYPSEEDPPTSAQRGAKPFGDRNYPNPGPKDIREARVGPISGSQRVIRGGSYSNPIEDCRVDTRESLNPYVHQSNVGFRCILPLPPEETTEESGT